MKWKIQRKRWVGISIVLTTVGLTLFSFQNCGKAGFDSSSELSLSSDAFDAANIQKYGPTAAERLKLLPFSFNAQFDQISIMSCSSASSTLSPDVFYTVRAGAYRTGGVSVRQEALDYINSNFTPIDQNRNTFTADEIKSYLSDAFVNSGAQMTLAVRSTRDLTSVRSAVEDVNGNVRTYPVSLLNDSLTLPSSLERLLNVGYKETFFRLNSNTSKRVFEGQLSLGSKTANNGAGNFTAGAFFDDMAKENSMLTLGFKPGGSKNDADLVNGSSSSGEGTGLRLRFDSAQNASSPFRNPEVILAGVSESNLRAPSNIDDTKWSCAGVATGIRTAPIPLIFQIVNMNDAKTYCLPESSSEMARYADPNYARILALQRKNMAVNSWDVNIHANASGSGSSSCVVPKSLSCYPDNSTVDYTLLKSCFNPLLGVCTHSGTANPPKLPADKSQEEKDCDKYQCSQFASTCLRL